MSKDRMAKPKTECDNFQLIYEIVLYLVCLVVVGLFLLIAKLTRMY